MKRRLRKLASVVLAVIISVSVLVISPITTSALTQNDVVSWMNSKNGTTIYDGGSQCVAAFNSYLRTWGISNPISKYPVNYAYQIFNYNAPDGWQKISGSGNYQVGDVVIWNSSVGGGCGHVGMVYSTSGGTVKIFDQNYVAKNVCGIHNIAQTSAIRGVFRPPLSSTPTGNNPTGAVDRIEGNRGSISVYGWAYDWDEINTSLDVHVYIGGPAGSGAECHIIKAESNSPDLVSVPGNHRFANIVETNLCGEQQVYLYAINVSGGDNVLIGSGTVTIIATSNNPIGAVDRIEGNRGSISVYGWAYDWDEINTSLDVHVYIGGPAGSGAECHIIKAESNSPDLVSVPGNHRFANIVETNLCGEQQVYLYAINVSGGNNVLIGSGTVNITTYTNISEYDISLSSNSYTYDGKVKTPTVTVKNDTATLVKDTDYTVEYSNNTNAGTATVTVTGIGNYTGTLTKTFTINKAPQTVNATISSNTINIGDTSKITASGQGTISYTSNNTDVVTVSSSGAVTGISAGTATIIVTAAGNSNYNSASKTISITVKKSYMMGDVNLDGTVNIDDVTLIQKYIANMSEFDSEQLKAADVTGDNDISIDDVTAIQKYLAGMITIFANA